MGENAARAADVLRSMNHKLVDDLLYVRHREQPVDDSEWDAFVQEIAANLKRGGTLKILVKTDNAGPNVLQRGKLNDLVASKQATLRIAVLSSSMMVRGIVTAFSWTGIMQIKSFSPRDYRGGLAYLGASVPPGTAERTMTDIEKVVG